MFIGSSRNLNKKIKNNSVLLNNTPTPRAYTFTCLRVDLDEQLSWEKHIEKTCVKVCAGIGAMRRIKPFVPPSTIRTIYKTLVYSYFDYCSPLWDNCGKVLENKLQKFQYCVARIITGTSYDVRSADVFDTLGWETFDPRRSPKKSILLYKILNHHTAPNLKGLFRKKNVTNQNAYYLRKSETDLMVAIPKTEFLN